MQLLNASFLQDFLKQQECVLKKTFTCFLLLCYNFWVTSSAQMSPILRLSSTTQDYIDARFWGKFCENDFFGYDAKSLDSSSFLKTLAICEVE